MIEQGYLTSRVKIPGLSKEHPECGDPLLRASVWGRRGCGVMVIKSLLFNNANIGDAKEVIGLLAVKEHV